MFVVSGAADFLLHVAVPDTDALYAFVIDRLTERPEVADVNTSVVYEHIRRTVARTDEFVKRDGHAVRWRARRLPARDGRYAASAKALERD